MWTETVVDRLLVQWRAEIDSVPMPELVSVERAVAIVDHARRARSA
ncbi:hypothetical protein [Amycolatopsis sp. 195334CR]|nr:hypothetical protein [Amycolatopsis sp. 195334CR]MBN6041261.1 hypothetical protein [Amycolatopsis sp. 195334CR]